MAVTNRGSILISTANDIGSSLVDVIGGEGYTPNEWSKKINLCGIAAADVPTALENIEESTPSGTDRGSISLDTANAVGAVLNKKFNTARGFKPSEWASAISKLTELEVKTASGSVASFDDGADAVPLTSLIATIAPNLDGVSSVTETQTGKNIYDKNAGVYDDTYFNQDGTTSHYPDVAVSWIRVKPNTQYTFSLGATPSRSTFLRWINCDKDKNFISRPVATYGSQNFPYTVTTPNDCKWVQLAINEYPAAQVSSNDWIIQIEENSSATAYEAYNGTTYTASLGRTIYGGEVDIVNGEGQEKYKIFTASDVTSLYWNGKKAQQVDTNHRATFRIALPSGYITVNNSLCNELSYTINIASGSGEYEGYQLIATAGIYFCIDLADIGMENATSDTPDEDFINAIHNYGDNLKFVVELATPTDFTFIGQEVPTRLGYNVFWSDCGDTEVTYRADIDLAAT